MRAIYNENLDTALTFLLRSSNVISITGAGGKTTLLTKLGDLFTLKGERTLITTTTHLKAGLDYGMADLLTGEEINERYSAVSKEVLKEKIKEYERVIIEADGSRGFPLKYHRETDPVVIEETDTTLAVVGLSSLGKKTSEVMFGYELYSANKAREEELVSIDTLLCLLNDKEGILKGARGKTFVVLNQADVLDSLLVPKVNELMFSLEQNYMLISLKENKLYAGVIF